MSNLGSIFGIGFPPLHGGALQYLNAYGLPAAMTRAHELAVEHGARFTPPVLLTRRSKSAETFS